MIRYVVPVGLLLLTIGVTINMPHGLQLPVAVVLIVVSYVVMRKWPSHE